MLAASRGSFSAANTAGAGAGAGPGSAGYNKYRAAAMSLEVKQQSLANDIDDATRQQQQQQKPQFGVSTFNKIFGNK